MRYHKPDIACDRSSIYGNPYEIGRDGDRNEVCDKFEKYFYEKLQDPDFHAKVMALKGRRLGCWCRCLPTCDNPKCKSHRCHVETIVKYLNET